MFQMNCTVQGYLIKGILKPQSSNVPPSQPEPQPPTKSQAELGKRHPDVLIIQPNVALSDEERRQAEEVRQRARKVAQEAVQRELLANAVRKREAAVKAANSARLERIDAEALERAATASLAQAVAERETIVGLLSEASVTVQVAQKALDDAKAHQGQILDRLSAATAVETEADRAEKVAIKRRTDAVQWEASILAAQSRAEQEERDLLSSMPPVDEETRRREELEESIRKMKELREQEEADKREKAKKEQQDKEDAERRKKEAERLAREERERRVREEAERKEREERERREEEARRLSAYKVASTRETERCRRRDAPLRLFVWSDYRSVKRFQDVCVEFDGLKFSDTQPLTFESVPWPLTIPPHKTTFDDIEWNTVEAFFAAAKLHVGPGEYKSFVEKAHRRFHPDKWRSRGLLNTVMDEDLRKRLEDAGNIVAQAITPIWLETKKMKS